MIPLAFSPTEIVFIDDKEDFFQPIAIALNENFSYSFFTDADRALSYIYKTKEYHNIFDECERIYESTGYKSFATRYDFSSISKNIYSKNRFNHVSVVIADYAMPQMNGLEFLDKITSKSIKKILLTGEADEKVAVNAFNNGSIDQYIRKTKNNLAADLNKAIYNLSKKFWCEKTLLPKQILSINYKHLPFENPYVEQYFDTILDQYQIVEYYLLEGSFRFLMLDGKGKTYTLWLQSKEEAEALAYEFQACDDSDAPKALKADVNSFQKIVCVPLRNGVMADIAEWYRYCENAEKIGPKGEFYAAIQSGCDLVLSEVEPFETLQPTIHQFLFESVALDSTVKCDK